MDIEPNQVPTSSLDIPTAVQDSNEAKPSRNMEENSYIADPSMILHNNLMSFLPTVIDAHKGNSDFHKGPTDLQSSFQLNDSRNLLPHGFLSSHQLNADTPEIQHFTVQSKHQPSDTGLEASSNTQHAVSHPESDLMSACLQESGRDLISHNLSKDSDHHDDIESSLKSAMHLFPSLFKCEKCEKQFFQLEDLLMHQKIEHSSHCVDVSIFSNTMGTNCDRSDSGQVHAGEESEPTFQNSVCGLPSDQISGSACNLKIDTHDEYMIHMNHMHGSKAESKTGDSAFPCDLCPKSFKTEDLLGRHKNRHPFNTPAIQCSKCREILGNHMLLKEHKQSEDYLSSCDICGQLFPNEECMMCHIRNTHNDIGDLSEDDSSSCTQPVQKPDSASLSQSPLCHSDLQEKVLEQCRETLKERFQEVTEQLDIPHKPVHDMVVSVEGVSLDPKHVPASQDLETFDSSVVPGCEENMESYLPTVPDEYSRGLEAENRNMQMAPIEEHPIPDEPPTQSEALGKDLQLGSCDEQSVVDDSGSASGSTKPQKMKCHYCSKKCSTRKSLLRHERCHPYGTAAMKCNHCLEVVENYKALKAHKKKSDPQVSCSTCDQICPNVNCLACHVRNVHNNSVYEVKPMRKVSYRFKEDLYEFGEEEASDEDNYLYSASRFPSSNSGGALRISIKREQDEDYVEPDSPSFSAPTPPTPPTPPPQGPPTPSPPPFIFESELSDANQENDDDEFEPYASDESFAPRKTKSSKGTSSMRTRRRSSINSVQYFSSSGESNNDESFDFNYTPQSNSESEEDSADDAEWGRGEVSSRKRTARKNQISDDDSDVDPDWGHPRALTGRAKAKGRRRKGPLSDESDENFSIKYSPVRSVSSKRKTKTIRTKRKKRNALSDGDSDNDPDWRKAESTSGCLKKKRLGRRGRGKKVQVAFFLPAIPVPQIKRPRARGLGGKKAQDAAAALAQAVEDIESTAPELKTVIRPVRRSVTKASLKRYSEMVDDEYDHLLEVKSEPKEVLDDSQDQDLSAAGNESLSSNHDLNEGNVGLDSNNSIMDQQEEEIVVKAEPYDFQDDDESETTDLYFSRKFCETNSNFEHNNTLIVKREGEVDGEIKRERFSCGICGRAMQYRSHLIRHLRKVHDGEGVDEVMRRLMHCQFCSKPYSNELSLINHEKLHDGTSKMKCNKCEERFDDKNALRRHQRKVHWEHQPVECDICKKQLSDNTCLKAHMKHMHGAEEKKVTVFTCESCGRQLHTKTAFQNHVASNCGTNLLFSCETCGKSFSFKGSLKAHQLIHTGVKSFLCKFCGKAFHQKGEMKRHERKHTGEKPFICEVCGRAFAYRESLIGHSAVHTGIKPFPCKACGMRFSCSGNLVKHRRSNNCKGFTEQGGIPTVVDLENDQEDLSVNHGVPDSKPASETKDPPLKSSHLSNILSTPLASEESQILTNGNSVTKPDYQGIAPMVTSQFEAEPQKDSDKSNLSEIQTSVQCQVETQSQVQSRSPIQPPSQFQSQIEVQAQIQPQAHVQLHAQVQVQSPSHLQDHGQSQTHSQALPEVQAHARAHSQSQVQPQSQDQSQHVSGVSSAQLLASHGASVAKSTPAIHVKPASALQSNRKETKQSAEVHQSNTMLSSVSCRISDQLSQMYSSHEANVTAQTSYGSHNLPPSYSDNHYRQTNQVNVGDRRFMQFSMDGYGGRTEQYFDPQSLMRHEMSRHAIERSVDRQSSRFLDWTSGVQFSGMDSRTALQPYQSASIPHGSAYANIHPTHLGNYASAHATSHSNSHANLYGGTPMMPSAVSFPAFAANNHLSMGYAATNPIPAHSVSHTPAYPTSHMSQLEALFGHFSHPTGTNTNNAFPRLSSHSSGTSSNSSLPSNHRV